MSKIKEFLINQNEADLGDYFPIKGSTALTELDVLKEYEIDLTSKFANLMTLRYLFPDNHILELTCNELFGEILVFKTMLYFAIKEDE